MEVHWIILQDRAADPALWTLHGTGAFALAVLANTMFSLCFSRGVPLPAAVVITALVGVAVVYAMLRGFRISGENRLPSDSVAKQLGRLRSDWQAAVGFTADQQKQLVLLEQDQQRQQGKQQVVLTVSSQSGDSSKGKFSLQQTQRGQAGTSSSAAAAAAPAQRPQPTALTPAQQRRLRQLQLSQEAEGKPIGQSRKLFSGLTALQRQCLKQLWQLAWQLQPEPTQKLEEELQKQRDGQQALLPGQRHMLRLLEQQQQQGEPQQPEEEEEEQFTLLQLLVLQHCKVPEEQQVKTEPAGWIVAWWRKREQLQRQKRMVVLLLQQEILKGQQAAEQASKQRAQ
ncbi:hypothetical protein ABPG75_009224 [Micractinium tetrahymenae]